jgi:hypothetical protein
LLATSAHPEDRDRHRGCGQKASGELCRRQCLLIGCMLTCLHALHAPYMLTCLHPLLAPLACMLTCLRPLHAPLYIRSIQIDPTRNINIWPNLESRLLLLAPFGAYRAFSGLIWQHRSWHIYIFIYINNNMYNIVTFVNKFHNISITVGPYIETV